MSENVGSWPWSRNARPQSTKSIVAFFIVLMFLQALLFYSQSARELKCEVDERNLESIIEEEKIIEKAGLGGPSSINDASKTQSSRYNDASRTAIYLVPSLFRANDSEMWFDYARHFVSHTCYALTHGYTLVLDTTNYVALPENVKSGHGAGSSEFVAESNWPYAAHAALYSQTKQKGVYDYDWVLMTDIDVMFVNDLSIPLSRFVNNFNFYASGSPIQVMVAQPFAHENFGEAIANFVILLRNSEDTRWFVDEWLRLLRGGCGPMTFGDQGYLHVALLRLIQRDRLRRRGVWVSDQTFAGDDTCETVCNMPDREGAAERTNNVQPQAPHEHERYQLTLACFERRSRELGLWRGDATFESQGPVAFSRISNINSVNRSLSYEHFYSGLGLNVNWDMLFSTEDRYRNLWDAVSVHSKIELVAAAYADTQRDYIHATQRCFGSLYMATPRQLFRRMLAEKRSVFQSSVLHQVGPAPQRTLDAKLATPLDLADLVMPAGRLRDAKPAWTESTDQVSAIVITTIPGSGTDSLFRMLRHAQSVEQHLKWNGDLEVRCATPNKRCPKLQSVISTLTGPINSGYFNIEGGKQNDIRSPYGMPMPFPNSLIEQALSNMTREFARAPPGVSWHFTMISHPAVRMARAWMASDDYEQWRFLSLNDQIPHLLEFAAAEQHVDYQVRTLMGCGPLDADGNIHNTRACCCHPDEQFSFAKLVLRHYITFFGIYERWSLSMRLLEATLRFGFGAPWFGAEWQSLLDELSSINNASSSSAKQRSTSSHASVWSTHAWRRPPIPLPGDMYFDSDNWIAHRGFTELSNGPADIEHDQLWNLLSIGQWYPYRAIESMHQRDTALYRFALAEFARRLDFFEIPIAGDAFEQ